METLGMLTDGRSYLRTLFKLVRRQ
eukprot:UN18758